MWNYTIWSRPIWGRFCSGRQETCRSPQTERNYTFADASWAGVTVEDIDGEPWASPASAAQVRKHLPGGLAAMPVLLLTMLDLRSRRDGLVARGCDDQPDARRAAGCA
jgi:hypothetical protein